VKNVVNSDGTGVPHRTPSVLGRILGALGQNSTAGVQKPPDFGVAAHPLQYFCSEKQFTTVAPAIGGSKSSNFIMD